MGGKVGTEQLPAVQALRATAALLVVFAHALVGIGAWRAAPALIAYAVFLGELGVYTFFVISGFIMLHTTGREYGSPGAPGRFFWRRLVRVAPLYWLATLLAIPKEAMAGRLVGGWFVAASFAFVPAWNGAHMNPIHSVGWTLNYEMFFYALFAATLSLSRRLGIPVLIGGLALLAAIGQVLAPYPAVAVTPLQFWTQPIILLFAVGVALSWVWGRVAFTMPAPALVGNAILALAAAFGWWYPGHPEVIALASIPAVIVAVLGRDKPVAATMRLLGDASYSLYLLHPFVVSGLLYAWHAKLGVGTFPAFFAVAVAASIAVAVAAHILVEKPMTQALRRFRPPWSGVATQQAS